MTSSPCVTIMMPFPHLRDTDAGSVPETCGLGSGVGQFLEVAAQAGCSLVRPKNAAPYP